MPEARVKIIFDDDGPDGGTTWVTSVPVRRSYPFRSAGVTRAAGEAVAIFIENIVRDREAVATRLAELEGLDA